MSGEIGGHGHSHQQRCRKIVSIDELERSGKETALVTLCIGVGMGTATILERV